jgi:protein-disulfide isomerase
MPLLEQVLKQNPTNVKVVFKNLPLKNHNLAGPAAAAALAAQEQGKFWQYHDLLFAEAKLDPDSFVKIAKKLRLDLDQFNKDRESPMLQEKLTKDVAEANTLGITGTPAVFVNGRKLNERSVEELQRMIDKAIQNEKKQ